MEPRTLREIQDSIGWMEGADVRQELIEVIGHLLRIEAMVKHFRDDPSKGDLA